MTTDELALSNERVCTEAYLKKAWGDGVTVPLSGPGSSVSVTAPYRQLLLKFFAAVGVRSVVDLGCGDWECNRAIDWCALGIRYTGIDIVKPVIEQCQQQF